jgi:hypothetical protein
MKNQHKLVLILLCILYKNFVDADIGGQKSARASRGPASLPADAILSFLIRWAEERDSSEPEICLLWGPLSAVRRYAGLAIENPVHQTFENHFT